MYRHINKIQKLKEMYDQMAESIIELITRLKIGPIVRWNSVCDIYQVLQTLLLHLTTTCHNFRKPIFA